MKAGILMKTTTKRILATLLALAMGLGVFAFSASAAEPPGLVIRSDMDHFARALPDYVYTPSDDAQFNRVEERNITIRQRSLLQAVVAGSTPADITYTSSNENIVHLLFHGDCPEMIPEGFAMAVGVGVGTATVTAAGGGLTRTLSFRVAPGSPQHYQAYTVVKKGGEFDLNDHFSSMYPPDVQFVTPGILSLAPYPGTSVAENIGNALLFESSVRQDYSAWYGLRFVQVVEEAQLRLSGGYATIGEPSGLAISYQAPSGPQTLNDPGITYASTNEDVFKIFTHDDLAAIPAGRAVGVCLKTGGATIIATTSDGIRLAEYVNYNQQTPSGYVTTPLVVGETGFLGYGGYMTGLADAVSVTPETIGNVGQDGDLFAYEAVGTGWGLVLAVRDPNSFWTYRFDVSPRPASGTAVYGEPGGLQVFMPLLTLPTAVTLEREENAPGDNTASWTACFYDIPRAWNIILREPLRNTATVRIPLPQGFSGDPDNLEVFYDGSWSDNCELIVVHRTYAITNAATALTDGYVEIQTNLVTGKFMLREKSEPRRPVILSGSVTIPYQGSATLRADMPVTWSGGNEYISVNPATGEVRALKGYNKSATITATAANGLSSACKVTIKPNFFQWLQIIFLFGWIWM